MAGLSAPFLERPSAFSPEDIYFNLLGAKIAGTVIRHHTPASEFGYDHAVTVSVPPASPDSDA